MKRIATDLENDDQSPQFRQQNQTSSNDYSHQKKIVLNNSSPCSPQMTSSNKYQNVTEISNDNQKDNEEDAVSDEEECRRYTTFRDYIAKLLGCCLRRVFYQNAQNAKLPEQHVLTIFYGSSLPPISLEDYMYRIAHYGDMSLEACICTAIYLNLIQTQFPLAISPLSIHRYLLAACLVSVKFHDDVHMDNEDFARIGGVSLAELNSSEIHFLHQINFSLWVSPALYDQVYRQIISAEVHPDCGQSCTFIFQQILPSNYSKNWSNVEEKGKECTEHNDLDENLILNNIHSAFYNTEHMNIESDQNLIISNNMPQNTQNQEETVFYDANVQQNNSVQTISLVHSNRFCHNKIVV